MKLKTLALTVAVLAALSVAAHFLTLPPPPPAADPRVGQPSVSRAEIEKAAQVRITDAGGGSVLLVKQSDASWRIASCHDLPVEFSRLSRFMQDLADSKVQRFVTARPERFGSLDFTHTQIALLDAAGREYWSVNLGRMSDSGARYARFGAETKAYLARINAWIETDPHFWAASALLALPPDTVAKIELSFADAPNLTITRANQEAPFTAASAPAGQKLDAAKIAALLEPFATLAFSDFTAPSDPAAAAARTHSRRITLTTFGGKTYTVELAQKPAEKPILPLAAAASKDAPPPNPVWVFVSGSDAAAPVNALMKLSSFQVNAAVYAGLPQTPAELFTITQAKP